MRCSADSKHVKIALLNNHKLAAFMPGVKLEWKEEEKKAIPTEIVARK